MGGKWKFENSLQNDNYEKNGQKVHPRPFFSVFLPLTNFHDYYHKVLHYYFGITTYSCFEKSIPDSTPKSKDVFRAIINDSATISDLK